MTEQVFNMCANVEEQKNENNVLPVVTFSLVAFLCAVLFVGMTIGF